MLRAVYLPIRRSLYDLAFGIPAVPIWISILGALALLRRAERYDRLYGIVLAASVGFAGAYFMQAKGWPYHSYPMIALALIALACAKSERRAQTRNSLARAGWAVAAGFLAAVTFGWMDIATSLASLEAPIRRLEPHPTMLAISHDISVGHPLVRAVGGTWVAPGGSMWLIGGALWRRNHEALTPAQNAELDRYVALDRAMLIDTLRRRKPDLIVIQKAGTDWVTWARQDADINDLLKPYREAITTPEMLVLQRVGP
jgi:hypothetical protein